MYLNAGLTINFNGEKFYSKNGLKDLLERKTDVEKIHYPVLHLKGDDIEMAFTHGDQYGEEYYSFVNGQHTTCLLYTSPSPRDGLLSRMPSSA